MRFNLITMFPHLRGENPSFSVGAASGIYCLQIFNDAPTSRRICKRTTHAPNVGLGALERATFDPLSDPAAPHVRRARSLTTIRGTLYHIQEVLWPRSIPRILGDGI